MSYFAPAMRFDSGGHAAPVFWDEIRGVVLSAMLLFTFTIGIGILNGADLVDFDQRRLLGHVHGGTLGWLTLSVIAASLWLFGGDRAVPSGERLAVRALCIAAVAVFSAYVAAFTTTYGHWRPALGILAVIVIVGFLVWVAWRATVIELGVPHWGILAALATSVSGGVLGVLVGLEIATGNQYLPDDSFDAHPATMVVGFLTPIAFAMSEWAFFFPKPPAATRSGLVQMGLLFASGVVLMTGFLIGVDPLLPVAILLQVIAVVIFLRRIWPELRAVGWIEALPGRYAAMAAAFVVYVVGLAFYLAIRYDGDFNLAPENQVLSLDHSQFIGAVTNGVFAMLLAATAADGRRNRLDQAVFFLVNVGLLGFAAGLLFDVTEMKRVFAPVMGVGLLLGLVVFGSRLFSPSSTVGTLGSTVPAASES